MPASSWFDRQTPNNIEFTPGERLALYKTIFSRRDVRGQFLPDPVCEEKLSRILMAAHHAPSVGFMQPWNFLVIRSDEVRSGVRDAFVKANEDAKAMFPEEKKAPYRSLKLEGIMESPLNICITCDRSRHGPVVIGRTSISTMDLFSTVCAVQNFWLAARAEGLGVGWVSIFKEEEIRRILGLPEEVVPVAYLCVGHVSEFFDQPELERKGWLKRLNLRDLIYYDQWENRSPPAASGLEDHIRDLE